MQGWVWVSMELLQGEGLSGVHAGAAPGVAASTWVAVS